MQGNLANGGLVLQAGNGVWISDVDRYSGTRCLDPSGGVSRIDGLLWFMNAGADAVYGSDQLRGGALCAYDPASGRGRLLSETPCSGLTLRGEWLYYLSEKDLRLYRCHTDGSGETRLTDEQARGFLVDEDRIYFSADAGIHVIRTGGKQRERLSACRCGAIVPIGGWLAFGDPDNRGTLTLIDKESGAMAEAFEDIEAGSIVADGRYLYVANLRNGGTIYRIDPIQGRTIRICGERAESLHIIGGDLFFRDGCGWSRMSLLGGQASRVELQDGGMA
ncbi:DUF5050 domain-containing protein [Paenibacillus humicus]|uniref:DUF5050 domain-containing protein n=1 Tax=Paenibacillus humicus TaxID=412861 RepID=UPI003F16C14F